MGSTLASGDLRSIPPDADGRTLLEVVIQPGERAWCIDSIPEDGVQHTGIYCSQAAKLLLRPRP